MESYSTGIKQTTKELQKMKQESIPDISKREYKSRNIFKEKSWSIENFLRHERLVGLIIPFKIDGEIYYEPITAFEYAIVNEYDHYGLLKDMHLRNYYINIHDSRIKDRKDNRYIVKDDEQDVPLVRDDDVVKDIRKSNSNYNFDFLRKHYEEYNQVINMEDLILYSLMKTDAHMMKDILYTKNVFDSESGQMEISCVSYKNNKYIRLLLSFADFITSPEFPHHSHALMHKEKFPTERVLEHRLDNPEIACRFYMFCDTGYFRALPLESRMISLYALVKVLTIPNLYCPHSELLSKPFNNLDNRLIISPILVDGNLSGQEDVPLPSSFTFESFGRDEVDLLLEFIYDSHLILQRSKKEIIRDRLERVEKEIYGGGTNVNIVNNGEEFNYMYEVLRMYKSMLLYARRDIGFSRENCVTTLRSESGSETIPRRELNDIFLTIIKEAYEKEIKNGFNTSEYMTKISLLAEKYLGSGFKNGTKEEK